MPQVSWFFEGFPPGSTCKGTPRGVKLGWEIPALIWVNYNDLTATEPWKSWLIRGIIPKLPYFRLVNYYNLPRLMEILMESSRSFGEDFPALMTPVVEGS